MTEKRFNMEYVHGNPTIWHITDYGEHIVDKKICDLLNELNDKNEQLKDEVYNELDNALTVLTELYEVIPISSQSKMNSLYNRLKSLRDDIK